MSLFDGDLQLFSVELIDVLEIDQLLELKRIQKRMNLLDLLALELTDGQSVKLLDIKDLASFSHLSVQFFHLLREYFLVLLLL